MDVLTALRPLERMESALSELYRWCSDSFAHDAEAAFVFRRLSFDEKAHAGLIEYQRRLVRANPKAFTAVEIDLEEVDGVRAGADRIRLGEVPSLEAAIRAALRFETTAAEFHYRTLLKQANPDIARLIDNLGRADREHLEALRRFAVARGIA